VNVNLVLGRINYTF